MPLRRLLGVILLVAASSMGVIGPAVAAPYGPHTGDATVNKTRVVQDSFVQLSGDGFCANADVAVAVSQGGDTYISRHVHADGAHVAATSVRLTQLGLNHLKLTGCFSAGGTQSLLAEVNVVAHAKAGHVNDKTVNKGDRVTVSSSGFCRNAKVFVRVFDDGNRYQAKSIHASRHGNATTSVKLTRAGNSTITLQGCRKSGGDQLVSVSVRVRNVHSFRSAPVAYAGEFAGSLSPARSALGGGGLLLLLFGAAQLMVARRHRSISVQIHPNG
jgi:hypothetical protein